MRLKEETAEMDRENEGEAKGERIRRAEVKSGAATWYRFDKRFARIRTILSLLDVGEANVVRAREKKAERRVTGALTLYI